jgi:acylglycerol lipase
MVSPALTAQDWTSTDGKKLPYQRWPKSEAAVKQITKPRGVVICVHGLSGASSDFWPAGESLPLQGYIVYGVELRGMGNDPDVREKGNIAHRQRWMDDLLAFTSLVRKQHPQQPIYWFGESLGALICIHSAAALEKAEQTKLIDGIILTSPVVDFRQEIPWWKYWPLRGLIALLPGKKIMLESLGDSEVKVTSETTHKGQMEKTPHYVPYFTLRLFGQVEKLVRGSSKAAERFHVPFLLLYTPNDVFTTREQLEAFFQHVGSADRQKKFFPQSYHLLLHDVDREPALAEIQRWLNEQNLTDAER